MFKQGDIVGLKATGIQATLNSLIIPKSDRWHFLLIGEYLPGRDDYIIYESLPDGIRCGRLSFYQGCDLKVYRVHDERIARMAAQEASEYGREGYDYILFVWLFTRAVGYWFKNGFYPIPYYEFTNQKDKKLICTELVAQCYENAGYPLIPPGIAPTPAALEQCCRTGRIQLV